MIGIKGYTSIFVSVIFVPPKDTSCLRLTQRGPYINGHMYLFIWYFEYKENNVFKTLIMFLYSYFRILVQQFEVQLQQYRQQIEELENHLATQANNSHIAPQGNMLSVVIFFIQHSCFVFCRREVKLLLNSRYSK